MRVWIDTDIGDNPDDAVALLTAQAHPDLTLAGVSTVDGDTEARAEVARRLVDGVSVVADADAVADAFVEAGPEVLLAIGPLTNVARMIDRGVRLPDRLVVMGGIVEPVSHRGAVRDVESNFGADPAAARLVIDWTDCTIVPLDVTVRMRLDDAEQGRLTAAHPALGDVAEGWSHDWVLHDPLAVLVAADDADAGVEGRPLAVDGRGRLSERSGARVHPLVVRADAIQAKRRILELLDA